MKSRYVLGYVVQIDGIEITLNLLDMHRGQLASHAFGVTPVTEIGSLLALDSGGCVLVMKVLSQSFAEPKEAHRAGVGTSTHQSEPLRHVCGVVVGRLVRAGGRVSFVGDSISTPPLGADAFPLASEELAAVLGSTANARAPILLGDDMRGGGKLQVGLSDLVSRHVAVLGSSGQGKSCFTAAVMQQVVRLPGSRIVVFDINGEYEDAFRLADLPERAVKVTKIGGAEDGAFRLPYYALGRFGLNRLLIPSDRTQRPALAFALDSLNRVKWFPGAEGVGLSNDDRAHMFDDCRQGGAGEANERITALREGGVRESAVWPHMNALSALIAESHAIAPNSRGGLERNAFNYGNVAPLITRIRRLIDDPMFTDVVDVEGGPGTGGPLNWQSESTALVEEIFGGTEVPWRVHIVDLRRVSNDLSPFVLGSLLELYAFELFRRGQERKIPTLLVLEEAHNYLRSVANGDGQDSSLAYERLAKEGRKFGLALWLSTQRPSEISPTVLSQCNNWISFRLISEKDLAAVQAASEWADRREVKRIAGLARQTAIVFGGSIAMPTLVKAATANPTPRSEDGAFDDWAVLA
jgi:uncharacterized protein